MPMAPRLVLVSLNLIYLISWSYCQMWCIAYSSGNLFLIGNLFNSIDEFNAGYNIS